MPETGIMPDHTIRLKMNAKQVPFCPDQLIKPPPLMPDIKSQDNRRMTLGLDLDINKDFGEKSLYQEGIISEGSQRYDKSLLLEQPELADLINTNNLVQKYLPKQTDKDKIFKIIQRKMLKKHTSPCNHKRHTDTSFFLFIYLKF